MVGGEGRRNSSWPSEFECGFHNNTHIPDVTFKDVSFSANVSPSSCILDFFPGLFRVSSKPFLFYVEEVNPFLPITKKGSSLPSLKNIFLPLHISCSYSSLSTSSHPKFSRKFSLLAVSICPLALTPQFTPPDASGIIR